MNVSVTVGGTTRTVDLQTILEHPQLERDPQEVITTQVMALFEAALGDEWANVRTQLTLVCDAMGWGYTR